MKQQSKKIAYYIFQSAPSEIVRAKVFAQEYERQGYSVKYFQLYSTIINSLKNNLRNKIVVYLLSLIDIKIIFPIKSLVVLHSASKFDGIILLKYVDPNFISKLKQRTKAKLLFDFDDAIWLEGFLGVEKFKKILGLVHFVSCDNSYLVEKSQVFNQHTFIVNGPAQFEFFNKGKKQRDNNHVIIGWIGSPSTLFYLYAIYDALEEIGSKAKNVKLIVVGTGKDKRLYPKFENLKVEFIESYNQAEMVDYVNSFDIGLYPLFNNQLSLGRGSLKATIYMAAGKPVVATSIGHNKILIQDGINGFLALPKEEWVAKLSELIINPSLREKMGIEGRKTIELNYSIEKCFAQLKQKYLEML